MKKLRFSARDASGTIVLSGYLKLVGGDDDEAIWIKKSNISSCVETSDSIVFRMNSGTSYNVLKNGRVVEFTESGEDSDGGGDDSSGGGSSSGSDDESGGTVRDSVLLKDKTLNQNYQLLVDEGRLMLEDLNETH